MVSSRPLRAVAEAYAKVNLHLWVGSVQRGACHPIASIFQKVSLSDTVTVTVRSAAKSSVRVNEMEEVPSEVNTLSEAVRLFCERTRIRCAVDIDCVKRIPVQSGLGGGSSDAATTLLLLNTLTGSPLDRDALSEIGLAVGSDVPFFLGISDAAFVEGRGEILSPLEPRGDLAGLIVMPKMRRVSTAKAFAALDALRGKTGQSAGTYDRDGLCAMYRSSVADWTFQNDFRAVMEDYDAIYGDLDRIVASESGSFGTLSGSGAAYCVLGSGAPLVERLKDKIIGIGNDFTLHEIKCLHRGDSGGTVSL